MPQLIFVLFIVGGFILDALEKTNQSKMKQSKQMAMPKIRPKKKKSSLVNPMTKQAWEATLFGIHDQKGDVSRQRSKTQPTSDEMSVFEEEPYEDEEHFETELTTPMSMVVEEDPLYSDSQWEKMAQENQVTRALPIEKVASRSKRTALQKAYIYSEIFGKPKGLD